MEEKQEEKLGSTDYISQVVAEAVLLVYSDQHISQVVVEVVVLEGGDIFGPKIQII